MEEGEQRRGEEMGLTVKQRQAVMEELRKQYRHASKKEKSRILDGFVDQGASQPFVRTQYPESEGGVGQGSRPSPSGIRLQGGGPPCTHGVLASFGQALWQASRPVPAAYHPLPLARGQLDLAPAVQGLLLRMSPATCDRLLQDVRRKEEPWEHPHPRPGMLLLRQVPVQTAAEWDPPRPGFVAVDLVTHEGSVAGGEEACTLDVTDARAGWTETRAVRNKNQEQVVAALKGIRSSLSFPFLDIHSEYGSEFMNNHQGPLPSARAHHPGTVTSIQEE